ncbi:glucosylceramidase-like [Diaphorina citri]|uniref:Glucosylceramidase n=1 Tax=Diaphorina citri TaxID=121845 RepID=A0A1S4ESB2_DIACI|nr:glucosylceramidase-like [Diaphorina citri]
MAWSIIVFLLFSINIKVWASPCRARKFDQDSVVCVCNVEYCDFEPPRTPTFFQYLLYTSDRDGKRFHVTEGNFRLFDKDNDILGKVHNGSDSTPIISIDLDQDVFQSRPSANSESQFDYSAASSEAADVERVEGFGGIFTDSAAINYMSLSPQSRSNLIRSYFGADGIGYNLCRSTIAGNDFSPRLYTYDDVSGDTSLSHFNLTEEDYEYKIPMIRAANLSSGGTLQLIASAWTAPPWMKDNNHYFGRGFLKSEFYQTYTDYLIKFLDHYKDNGIDVWALTTGNEPTNALYGDWPEQFQFNNMGWSPFGMSKWIGNSLGPSLKSSRHSATKIFTLDDQKVYMPWYITLVSLWSMKTKVNGHPLG